MPRQEEREIAQGQKSSFGEHSHLRGRSNAGDFVSDAEEPHGISEPARDLSRPAFELLSCPFAPMIVVAEVTRRQVLEYRVVFDVRCCNDHRHWSRELEDHALECRQSGQFKMFDDLDGTGSVEAFESFVAIRQGALKELDSVAL